MYVLFFVSGTILLIGLYRHLRSYGISLSDFFALIRKGFPKKAARFLKFGVQQPKVLEGGSGGFMHGALFFGFLMLLAYTTIIFIENDLVGPLLHYSFLQGSFYLALEFLGDSLGLAFIVGLVIALYRRYVQKLSKLETRWDDAVVLSLLVWIGVSGFLVEAFRFETSPVGYAVFSPVGYLLSLAVNGIVSSSSDSFGYYQVFWWAHMISVFLLIAVTPYTKLVHVFTSGFNVALAPEKPMGRLNTPFSLVKMMESESFEMPKNARTSSAFTPLQLLALDACTNCGRCQEVCPAYAAGRDLSPRIVVQDLGRDVLQGDSKDVFETGIIRENELWACTTCNACVSICPVFINQVDYIVDYRRTLVAENKLDSSKKRFLENIASSNNPFGLPQNSRQSWLGALGAPTTNENPSAEYLYWVGCQSSYDQRGQGVARAMVKILRAANVNFAILGNDERCTGEPVRRLGEEARFQELALKNIATIKSTGIKKIIVHCAHCFNTFLNEYPEFGSDFEVVHHTQLVQELISAGRIKLREFSQNVTFHDPCNLGRINGVIDPPREVLKAISGLTLTEMPRNGMNSFCCGGGGANVWYQVPEKKKISVIRIEEAKNTGAGTLAVACPFCITMFDDALNTISDHSLVIKDVAEIVAEKLIS
jgi:Fe-S oxidoreductase/nitrate reductase gamma subunit